MCATTSKTKRSAEKNGKDCSSTNEAEVTRYLEGRLSLRVASGSYDHTAQVPLVSAPVPAVHFSKIPALTPLWVQSPFLGACIFEHAPPAHA